MRPLRKIFQRPAGRQGGRHGGIHISVPMACVIGVSLGGVLLWAFFMGLMVGRGQHPETRLREMTGWQLAEPESPAKMEQDESRLTENKAQLAESTETDAEDSKTGASAEQVAETAHNSEYPFAKPGGEQTAAWASPSRPASQGPKPAGNPEKTGKSETKPARKNADPLFDYSFQIAAFKTAREADALRQNLEKLAVRSSVRKSGKVHLVLAQVRGSATAPVELQKKLDRLKSGKPLLLSKKPVKSTPARKR